MERGLSRVIGGSKVEMLVNKPKTKRGKATLERILSAAEEVFYEKGYHGASINDITSRAEIGAGTFYIYFDSKYNLYRHLLLQCSHKIRKHLSMSIHNCATRQEAERAGMRSWLQFVRENRYMYHIIWESLYVDKALFVDYYVTFADSYMKGLNAAKEKGEVRDIDSEILAYTLMGATNFMGLNWGLFKEEEVDLDWVTDEFMKIINGGIFCATPEQKATGETEEKSK